MADESKCGRSACSNPHDDCIHTQSGKKYCKSCAIRINRANPEMPRLVFIPFLVEIQYVQDKCTFPQRIRDIVQGAYGGGFDLSKSFGEQDDGQEPSSIARYALEKVLGISRFDQPRMHDMTMEAFCVNLVELKFPSTPLTEDK